MGNPRDLWLVKRKTGGSQGTSDVGLEAWYKGGPSKWSFSRFQACFRFYFYRIKGTENREASALVLTLPSKLRP